MLLPLPLVPELLGEQVAVGVALGVEPRARVAIPEPGAARRRRRPRAARHREAGLASAVELVDAGDAGADDQDVDRCSAGPRSSPAACALSMELPVATGARGPAIVPTGWYTVRAWRSWTRTTGARRAVRDEAPRPGTQGALLRPGVLPAARPSSSGRAPGRWHAGSRRSRSRTTSPSTRSSTSRSSSCAPRTAACTAFQNACRHRGVKVARGSRVAARPVSPARSTAGATAPTAGTPPSPGAGPSASTTCEPGDLDLVPGALRDLGRLRVDQPRRRRRRRCASASSRSPP